MNKNIDILDLVDVELNKSDNIDWVTPFFDDLYKPQKVEVINNLEYIKLMSNRIKIVNRRLTMDVQIYDSTLKNVKTYIALIDTGSQETLISQKVINDLKLTPNGKFVSVNNSNKTPLYNCVLNFTTSTKAYPIECTVHNISKYDIVIGVNILELVETVIENGEFEIITK